MNKRLNLKIFRVGLNLKQSEMAARMGIGRTQYQMIECGKRNGGFEFWQRLQTTFNIPAGQMWELMQKENEGAQHENK